MNVHRKTCLGNCSNQTKAEKCSDEKIVNTDKSFENIAVENIISPNLDTSGSKDVKDDVKKSPSFPDPIKRSTKQSTENIIEDMEVDDPGVYLKHSQAFKKRKEKREKRELKKQQKRIKVEEKIKDKRRKEEGQATEED